MTFKTEIYLILKREKWTGDRNLDVRSIYVITETLRVANFQGEYVE